jgi:predicted RNA-binding protein with PUA-like domain
MNHWLLKSEPESFSWQDMKRDITTKWDGVRNYQARNYMMQMKPGDKAFFYHSGKDKEIVGIVEIISDYYPDPSDPRFAIVDVKYLKDLNIPVPLQKIKMHHELTHLSLIRQSRLSVMPIGKIEWEILLKLAGS